MKTTNIPTLTIHKLTQAQYDRELANGNIDENAIYLTPDNSSGATPEGDYVDMDTFVTGMTEMDSRVIELEKVDHDHTNKAKIDTYDKTQTELLEATEAYTNQEVSSARREFNETLVYYVPGEYFEQVTGGLDNRVTAIEDIFNEGGAIDGDLNVNGVIRANSQQAFYYNAGTSTQTIGSNNATGGTIIACGTNGTVSFNGAITKTPLLLPKATNTYTCGNSNFRWSGIYSTAAVNVSSDERLKRDITPVDADPMVEFVKKLNVVSYNYKDDAEDAKARIGLVAQQVRQADPNAAEFFVSEDENGMLGLTPSDLVFPLIQMVQRLSAEIEELKSKM